VVGTSHWVVGISRSEKTANPVAGHYLNNRSKQSTVNGNKNKEKRQPDVRDRNLHVFGIERSLSAKPGPKPALNVRASFLREASTGSERAAE